MLEHKGYVGQIQFDDEAEIFHGEIINIKDVITFQGKSVKELKKAFVNSIEDYLAFCESRGESPDRPFSGKLHLRLDPNLHRDAYISAAREGLSLNTWITNAIIHQSQTLT